jgi:ATP-binding cassette subfamily F protein uup
LVLDEPTNDLDMETLDLLQELVAGFAGTVILVSHDRDFLDRTVTSTIAPNGDGTWTEYAGGYTDMLAQRGGRKLDDRRATARAAPAAKAAAEPKGQPRQPAKKLSYKQKFTLETLPKRMEEAVATIGVIEERLADPNLYRRDPKAFAAATEALDKARAELAALEDEWLELEMLREEIEG